MSYNICLFDLDGTLTDPKLGITKSFQYALAAFGISEELVNLEKCIGPPLRESFKNYGFTDSDTEKAVTKFREYFSETGLLENTVYPEIPAALEKLKDSGKILAVATSKAADYAKRILTHFNLDEYFVFVSGDKMDGSLTVQGKKELIRIALEAIDPEGKMSAVMIGDRKHDIEGAAGAGISSIGVTWGYGSREELETAGATWVVDSVEEMYSLINNSREK